MDVCLLYVEDCPNVALARERVAQALTRHGLDTVVQLQLVASGAEAERLGFRGSPTILVDGRDPFGAEEAQAGFSCRLYRTEAGTEGAPSVSQLEAVLRP